MATNQTTETTTGSESSQAAPESRKTGSASALAAFTAERPLTVLSEELGSDPYNHTGRFSKPSGE